MSTQYALYFLVAQFVAIALSALGVIVTVIWNRNVARRRATIDMILMDQTNEALLSARSKFLTAVRSNLLEELTERDRWYSPESFFFVSTCNRYEIVAVGIQEGIIDEKIYKRYWRRTVVLDWIRVKPAILLLRRRANHPEAFCDFETLACRWATPDELARIRALPQSN